MSSWWEKKKQDLWGKCTSVSYVCGSFFLRLQTENFMLSSFVFNRNERKARRCFRNEFDCSRRGTQTSFPLLDCRNCENFGLPRLSIWLLKKQLIRAFLMNCQFSQSPLFDQLSVFRLHSWKTSYFEILANATPDKRKTGWGTPPRVHYPPTYFTPFFSPHCKRDEGVRH